ncbi:GNAT family N-acetyltransferase [Metabacillus rhizolycopersici]|uniref:GNAT family N-acetyltransferase n=1 Tax=Metabacillus rhizolycopersici TaxID=2875709 RepID=A0ABS7UZL3_9BACI|nr:GNAT family N-acetyltransferase [Metabacillus rhizolycopersici]MBZ5753340.1 GNAT family N-acetyltransferase [Metabacillus rhizolycopersici]
MNFEEELYVESFKPEVCNSGFSCGNDKIDYIFNNQCAILEREGKATTNLFYLEEELVGFCTLLADRLSISPAGIFLEGEYPTYYPAIQLYSIGVKAEYQADGIGSLILKWVIGKGFELRKNIGVSFLLLEAFNDQELIKFYTNNGFVDWKYLERNEEDLIPMVYDYRGLDGVI